MKHFSLTWWAETAFGTVKFKKSHKTFFLVSEHSLTRSNFYNTWFWHFLIAKFLFSAIMEFWIIFLCIINLPSTKFKGYFCHKTFLSYEKQSLEPLKAKRARQNILMVSEPYLTRRLFLTFFISKNVMESPETLFFCLINIWSTKSKRLFLS
jgi:hypothetical protein